MKTAAIDIETTGTTPADQITVVGIDIPMGSRVFLNTNGRPYPETITENLDAHFDRIVRVTACESEAELLEAFRAFTQQRFTAQAPGTDADDDEFKFAAYNGETWNGGFDLPFIRTRCQQNEVTWPLCGPYIDVMEVIGTRFNVSDKQLETTYRELVGDGLNDSDPFEDSGEAVTSWQQGEFEPLLGHNVADIRRTRALVRVAEQYCSTSHFSMRSLAPVDVR